MTRINTNVSSLVAQKTLARSNEQLQTALTRLSTGLRINRGKDDPAGLIASEVLRSDIISVQRAITNSQRANQVIGTADSALGQVSSLLNDIRGLVSEAANTGALSEEQITANQLQVDSSLEAIDRIAQITSFQGRKLLDGSLDFLVNGVDTSKIKDLKIDQANFGTLSQIGIKVDIAQQAARGQLEYAFGAIANDVVLEVGGANGTEAFTFAGGSSVEDIASAINLVSDATGVEAEVQTEATKGELTISSFGRNNDIVLTAETAGFDEGDVRIKYTLGNTSGTTATYTPASGSNKATINVALQTEAYTSASIVVDQAGNDNDIRITSKLNGEDFNGTQVAIVLDAGAAGSETLDFDGATNTLTIHAHANSNASQVVSAFSAAANEKVKQLFSAALVETAGGGNGAFAGANNANAGVFAGGVTGGAILATANDIVAAINDVGFAGPFTAALATGNDGYTAATEFQQFAYNGTPETNTRLQFLAGDNAPKIRFSSTPGQALSVAFSPEDGEQRVEDFASATIQDVTANASIVVTAKVKGTAYDGISVKIVDNANVAVANNNEFAIYDEANKTLTINVDSTNSTAQDVIDAINNDTYLNQYFQADGYGNSPNTGVISLNTGVDTSGGLTNAGVLVVNLATDADGIVSTTANDLISYFNASANAAFLAPLGVSVTNAGGSDGSGILSATTADLEFATEGTDLVEAQAAATTYAVRGNNARITFTAKTAGAAYDGVQVVFQNDDGVVAANNGEYAQYNASSKTLTIFIDSGVTTAADVVQIFTAGQPNYDSAVADLFTAAVVGGGGTGIVDLTDGGTLAGGVVDDGTVDGAKLLGNDDAANAGLTFRATEFGSENFVSVKALQGSFSLTNVLGATTDRSVGTDVNARINGIQAVARGLQASINTASLDLTFTLDASVTTGESLTFAIIGGGAQFQLGPDVVSNQQARLGIAAVNTAKLGGVSGNLFQLRSGGEFSLTTNVSGAAKIIEEVITQITSLRGRLGAFQKTTLETNIYTLSDTLENLTDAESSIRDADFAAESASLTRAQILVQSGTSVLQIANSNPQNVLALLR